MGAKKAILLFIATAGLVAALGLAAFLKSGVYDIAALTRHVTPEQFVITLLKRYSVNKSAKDLPAVSLNGEDKIRPGLKLYLKHCESCHGGVGAARSATGKGLNPNPPPLSKATERWSDKELVWIIHYGLKMAGMPGFGDALSREDIYAVSSFVARMNTLSPREYSNMKSFASGKKTAHAPAWEAPEQGWKKLKERGNREKGKALLAVYGCKACHTIPGIPGASAHTGPPLTHWTRRQFIAGEWVNNPINLVKWLVNPENAESKTLMPDLGIGEQEAWDMAAYLFELD